MSYQIKFLSWPESGNHIIVISRGAIDANGFKELFTRVDELVQPLPDCKILLDLEDAIYDLPEAQIDRIFDELNPDFWASNLKIAVVARATTAERDQLLRLSTRLSKMGIQVAVFYDTKAAIDWLSETRLSAP